MSIYVVERVFGNYAELVGRFEDFADAKDAFWNGIISGEDYEPEVGTMGAVYCYRLSRVIEDESGLTLKKEELMESQDLAY
jgi:hypothetical protein